MECLWAFIKQTLPFVIIHYAAALEALPLACVGLFVPPCDEVRVNASRVARSCLERIGFVGAHSYYSGVLRFWSGDMSTILRRMKTVRHEGGLCDGHDCYGIRQSLSVCLIVLPRTVETTR